jgi:hypothetical protein
VVAVRNVQSRIGDGACFESNTVPLTIESGAAINARIGRRF